MCTHKNTAPYSISLGAANVYSALTPLYENNVYILYPASKGPFDLPTKVNLSRKIEGSSARRVVWEERWVDCRSMEWFYFVVEETKNAFKESLVTLQAKLTR